MPDKYVARVDKFFCFNDQNNCERVLKEIIKNDKEILPLLKRVKLCYKEHGLKYTIKRIFVKIFRG